MRTTRKMAMRFLGLAIAVGISSYGVAQVEPSLKEATNSGTQSSTEQLRKLDQLIEQNKKLEDQNRSLMTEIESLRSTGLGLGAWLADFCSVAGAEIAIGSVTSVFVVDPVG